jgi:hypothetical protein
VPTLPAPAPAAPIQQAANQARPQSASAPAAP